MEDKMKNHSVLRVSIFISALLISSSIFASNGANKSKSSDASHNDTSHIFISNRDSSMSMVRCKVKDGEGNISCEEKQNEAVSFRYSWPANQYRGNKNWWWAGLGGKVLAMKTRKNVIPLTDAKNLMEVNTYTYAGVPAGLPTNGANFIGVSPDGKTAWNSAREIDEIQEIDADPESPTFGQILTHITVPLSADAGSGSASRGKMRPCDMSITPDGKYLWEPDIGGETVTGVDIKGKTVIAQITLPRENPANRVVPFMLTTNGKIALVENFEGPTGSESIIDVSDPENPVHLKKLTAADGLGITPMTSEFTPDGKYAYIITNGSPSTPGAIEVLNLKTLQLDKKIALPNGCRPHTGDFTNDGNFFVVNCSGTNTVAVVSNKLQEVVQNVALSGVTPRGITVR
jgi:DNA-binding beta-propeller fold protein YncE